MAETFVCSVCHTEHAIEDLTTFCGRNFCPECLQAEICVCDRCGERIWLLDACCDETHTLCETCEENRYARCADCGRLVEYSQLHYVDDDDDDDDEGYCENCCNHHCRERGVQSYCYKPESIFYGDGTCCLDVLYTAKHKGDRYTCVNLTPSQAIEFRMFRGTLKYNTLIATLQMVEIICDVASALSDNEIKKLTWTEFVSNLYEDTTPELIQYLKERQLYVNEPVYSTEEEV